MKKISAAYNKLADLLDRLVYIIGGAGIIVCAGMCGANILMWWFMGKRIAICDEISLFGLVWATYMGMGILFRMNGHCTMDFVVKAMPPKVQTVIRVVTDIAILVVCVITVHYSWVLSLKSLSKKLILTKIPYFYVDIPITLGYAHLLILAVGDIVISINKLIHWKKG